MPMNLIARQLFDELAGKDATFQAARLADPAIPSDIRAEVESLLRIDGTGGSVIGGRVAAAAARALSNRTSTDHDSTQTSHPAGTRFERKLSHELLPGDRAGNYRIVRLLGEGGMGRVYEAEQIDNGRRVALKLLHSTAPTQEDRDRFLREGRLAAAVSHPNSVFVFGTEEIGPALAIVMELVDGGTLKEQLTAQGPMDITAASSVMRQLLDGLEAAHNAGVLHRDIKPSNCFLDYDGSVKLGDFGISRAAMELGVTTTLTLGSFAGTPAYASPEQLQGSEIDERADIYSIGATFYHLLTGRPPFDQRDMIQLLAAVMGKVPASPHELRPEVSRALSDLVMKCLAKDPARRFASAAEMRRALVMADLGPAAAGFWRRYLAAFIDFLPLIILSLIRGVATQDGVVLQLAVLVFYGVIEGRWGLTLGKAAMALRVLREDGSPLGLARGLARKIPYIVFTLTASIQMQAQLYFGVLIAINFLYLLSTFWAIGRRHGFATTADILTGAWVVPVTPLVSSNLVESSKVHPPAPTGVVVFGPYLATSRVTSGNGTDIWLAIDPALKRNVWVVEEQTGVPPLLPERRDLRRHSRPRWLAGQRTHESSWDAYAVPEGQPLSEIRGPVLWPQIRNWFVDIVAEVRHDPSLAGQLSIDRIWITSQGHAVTTDFPVSAPAGIQQTGSVRGLLNQILDRFGGPLRTETPATVIEQLSRTHANEMEPLHRAISDRGASPFRFKRRLQLVTVIAIVLALSETGIIPYGILENNADQDVDKAIDISVGDEERERILHRVRYLVNAISTSEPERARQWMDYTVLTYRKTIDRVLASGNADESHAAFLRQLLQRQSPNVPENARKDMAKHIHRASRRSPVNLNRMIFVWFATSCLFALISGSYLVWRKSGLALVQRDGHRASRLVYAARSALLTIPAGVAAYVNPAASNVVPLATLSIYAAGVAWSFYRLQQSPVDALLGTTIVPD